jgi:hypothetical protein
MVRHTSNRNPFSNWLSKIYFPAREGDDVASGILRFNLTDHFDKSFKKSLELSSRSQ